MTPFGIAFVALWVVTILALGIVAFSRIGIFGPNRQPVSEGLEPKIPMRGKNDTTSTSPPRWVIAKCGVAGGLLGTVLVGPFLVSLFYFQICPAETLASESDLGVFLLIGVLSSPVALIAGSLLGLLV